jgi:hypothetical protein
MRAAGHVVGERLRAAAFLSTDEVDGAAMDECEDPRARLRPFGPEGGGAPPDREKPLLDCVLREPLVPQHTNSEPVRDAADAIVELPQRTFVATGDERNQGLVGEVSVALAHGPAWLDGQR